MFGRSGSILVLIDRWRRPAGWRSWFAVLGLVVLALGATQLTYSTGGTRNVYLHAMYVPVALAGMIFRLPGGLVAGLAAGLLLGPFMPINVEEGLSQSTSGWVYRLGFFVLLGALVGQLSQVLNMRLDQLHEAVDSLASAYAHTLRGFASLVAYRDRDTAGHCDRVANNARVLGERLGLGEGELDDLYWAGVLHDLGKVAVPTELLLKDGPLTVAEFAEVKKHAAVGADLLSGVSPDFAAIAAGVRSHHERWDGKGYPDGLRGEEIPVFGRILAVVDVFEALTSVRPYRGPMEPGEALDYIREGAGLHFDPRMVRVLEEAYAEGELWLGRQKNDTMEFVPPRVPAMASSSEAN